MENTTTLVVYEAFQEQDEFASFYLKLNSTKKVDFIKMSGQNSKPISSEVSREWLEVVEKQVSSLRFGVVQITVHDSRVVQVETTERLRFDKAQTDSR